MHLQCPGFTFQSQTMEDTHDTQGRLCHKKTKSFTHCGKVWCIVLDKCDCFIKFILVSLMLTPATNATAEGQVRLVGSSRCYGRVEVFLYGEWGTVCDDGWTLADAGVVCRQLHCGKAMDFIYGARFGEGSGKIWLGKCLGNELALRDCRSGTIRECKHHEDAGVICMNPPEISVAPAVGVLWGQTASVSCSVDSDRTKGFLILRHFNETLQISKSNPATFTFRLLSAEHQGPYSCVYEETILEKTYSSPQSDAVMIRDVMISKSQVPLVLVVALSAAGAVLLLLLLLLYAVCRRRSRKRHATRPQRTVCAWRGKKRDEIYVNADLPHDPDDNELAEDPGVYNNVENSDDYNNVEVVDDYEDPDSYDVREKKVDRENAQVYDDVENPDNCENMEDPGANNDIENSDDYDNVEVEDDYEDPDNYDDVREKNEDRENAQVDDDVENPDNCESGKDQGVYNNVENSDDYDDVEVEDDYEDPDDYENC